MKSKKGSHYAARGLYTFFVIKILKTDFESAVLNLCYKKQCHKEK